MRNEESLIKNALMCYHLGWKQGLLTEEDLFVSNYLVKDFFSYLVLHKMVPSSEINNQTLHCYCVSTVPGKVFPYFLQGHSTL